VSAAFRALARQAAARYPARDRYARHFAYGKLTGDPIFRHVLENGLIPANARLLDLGCGQALTAALLAAEGRHGDWRYRGIDLSSRDIERARAALPSGCEAVAGDICDVPFGEADLVLVFDVLHYIGLDAQAAVLRRVREALAPGGTLLMRVADASAGWRFRYTQAIDFAVTRLRGHRVSRLWSLPLAERVGQLQSLGFQVEPRPMSQGTPFANVLLVAR
jgi:SAM-dependent methyltransferase